jgi:hypothetical protein
MQGEFMILVFNLQLLLVFVLRVYRGLGDWRGKPTGSRQALIYQLADSMPDRPPVSIATLAQAPRIMLIAGQFVRIVLMSGSRSSAWNATK